MPRKITSGKVGGQILGSIGTEDNTFQSLILNSNIILEPNGTGITESTSDLKISNNNNLQLSSNNTNNVQMKAPTGLTATYTLTFPADDGDSGETLLTDGSGNLSWSSISLTLSDKGTVDSTAYYPTFISSGDGTELGLMTNATNGMTFIPNPGQLSVRDMQIRRDATVGNDLVVTADLSAATITETSSIVYKENVNPISDALNTVLQLQGVTYDRKNTTHKSEAGLIAEEVAKILPNIVSFKDGKPEGINYTKITAYLIEAVKSLKEEIDSLKKSK